tara:strand:+ start:61 stop:747 length:687 start_codon:yes stop_codon:yes gene_type:complete
MSCANGYPNISNFNLESFDPEFMLGGVKSNWCPKRCRALGKAKGLFYLRTWGFAYARFQDVQLEPYEGCLNATEEVEFPYDCGIFNDPLGIWGTAGSYDSGSGSHITIAETRDLIDCQVISGSLSQAAIERGNYATDAGTTSGKERRKNLCNEAAWKYIEDFFHSADSASQNFISCYNVLQTQILEEGEDELGGILDSIPEPMSNLTLAAIIGGSGLAMILILNKVVR